MTGSAASIAADYRDAFYAMATTKYAANTGVVVAWTGLGIEYADDVILIGGVRTTEEIANMSASNRGREVTLELTVIVSSFRSGGNEADQLAFRAAADIVNELAEQVRQAAPAGDTTLGGVVRHCFLTNLDSDAADAQTQSGTGRVWEIEATFTAKQRIRG